MSRYVIGLSTDAFAVLLHGGAVSLKVDESLEIVVVRSDTERHKELSEEAIARGGQAFIGFVGARKVADTS